MGEQGVGAEADHVGGGLVARDEQQQGDSRQFLVGQLLAGDEPADQVVTGVGALAADQLRDIVEDGEVGGSGLLGVGAEVEEAADGAVEAVGVLQRDAEEFADDQRGNGLGELLDEVGLPCSAGLHRVQAGLGDLLDARGEESDAPLGELPGHQPPVAAVLGCVHPDEEADLRGPDRFLAEGMVVGGVVVQFLAGAELGVREQRAHLGIAGDQPPLVPVGEVHPRDRALLPQLGQFGRGIEGGGPLGGKPDRAGGDV